MKNLTKEIRNEIKGIIIANKGVVLNADVVAIYDRFRPLAGIEIVSIVQNAISYFRFSPQQEEFRKKYNFQSGGVCYQ
jgi:hypothetical protein